MNNIIEIIRIVIIIKIEFPFLEKNRRKFKTQLRIWIRFRQDNKIELKVLPRVNLIMNINSQNYPIIKELFYI